MRAELRTGMGAHFRYAEHLSKVLHKFYEYVPEARQMGDREERLNQNEGAWRRQLGILTTEGTEDSERAKS